MPRCAKPLPLKGGVRGSGGERTSRKLSEEELKLMVESGYSSKAIKLYVDNVNVGKLENPTVATTFLGSCGDLIKLYLKINDKKIIEDEVLLSGLPGLSFFHDYAFERHDN